MNIDWEKAEKDPESKQKVKGIYLLELKSKINDLQRRVLELRKHIENEEEIIIDTKIKLANSESFLKELLAEASNKGKIIDKLDKKNKLISNKKEELEQLRDDLTQKIEEYIQVKKELYLHKDRIMELQNKITKIGKNLADAKSKNDLIVKIEKIMKLKGFLSEKELELLKAGKKI